MGTFLESKKELCSRYGQGRETCWQLSLIMQELPRWYWFQRHEGTWTVTEAPGEVIGEGAAFVTGEGLKRSCREVEAQHHEVRL